MANDILNLPASLGIYRFQIQRGIPYFSADHQQIILPFTGYGDPAQVADLTSYQYSLNGITWSPMTAAVGTVLTDLDFTSIGEAHLFTWEIKTDLGSSIYNKNIYTRFIATSSILVTAAANYTVYLPKIVVNQESARDSRYQLPEDYQGISGSDLLEKAPKTT